MNNMTDANKNGSDGNNFQAGSPETVPDSNTNPAGQTGNNNGQGEVTQEMYAALERKLGEQGTELGAHREFVENITPLLEKLDANPELVQAIVDGKIDQTLAKAVLDGKVNIGDAQAVTTAAKQVEKEVGKTNMQQMTPEQVEKLIEDKVNASRASFEEAAQLKDFESRTQSFIESTTDFTEYAEEIDKWLDNHNVSDIEIAYYAVKGQMSTKQAKQAAEEAEAERAKEIALNAAGGGSYSQTTPDGRPIIDDLVGGSSNPLFN